MAEPVLIFEPIIYKVKEPCKNPVMVLWLNSLGGWSQWLFEHKQDASVENELGDAYEVPFTDLETTNRTLRQRRSSYVHSWVMIADQLTKDELLALQELKTSEAIYVLRTDDVRNVEALIGVTVEGLTTAYKRQAERHLITINVVWPRDFNPERWLNFENE